MTPPAKRLLHRLQVVGRLGDALAQRDQLPLGFLDGGVRHRRRSPQHRLGLPLAQALDAALAFLQRRGRPLDLLDELPPHGGGERQPADGARDVDPGTTDTPHGPHLHAPAALADGVRPPLPLAELPQRAGDLLGVRDEPLRAARQVTLGQLGVRQRDGVTERALARGDLLRDDADEVRDQQAARHRLRDAQLAPLDALRDRHLALARQQRHATHLAQVRPHQILALILLVYRQRLLGSRSRRHARRRPALDVRLHLLGALDPRFPAPRAPAGGRSPLRRPDPEVRGRAPGRA